MTYGDFLRNSDDEGLAFFMATLIIRTAKETNEKGYTSLDIEDYSKEALKILRMNIEED